MSTYADILDYWFGSSADDAEVARQQGPLWWRKRTVNDQEITRRFGGDLERAAKGGLDDWATTPRGRLALIIVLDQFSRTIHRETPQAFATDERALALCLAGLDRGDDQQLRPIERMFFYMPLEHSESLDMQRRSVACYAAQHRDAAEPLTPTVASNLRYAERHLEIIERFGRFPHRNAVLGRASTPEELEFLQQPGSSF
jgi:uncharacterized protein (DUF924 family)